jgi:PadR family transcriptional regulator, regulatory protein PadR
MIGRNRYKNRIELLQGTLDMLILQTLQWGPSHGYGIVQALRANSGDVLQVETGSLYPALHRLENRSLLAADWKQTDTGREAKFYRLTRKGRAALASEEASWNRLTEAVAQILGLANSEGSAK